MDSIIQKLSDSFLELIEEFLLSEESFYPFGVLMNVQGKIQTITILDDIPKDLETSFSKESIKNSFSKTKEKIVSSIKETNGFILGGCCKSVIYKDLDSIQMSLYNPKPNEWMDLIIPFSRKNGQVDFKDFILLE